MKLSFWDILSVLALLGTAVVVLVFWTIFNNPYTPLNPFQPPTLPAKITVEVNDATATSKPIVFPQTWTPTEYHPTVITLTPRNTNTTIPSRTPFAINTFTRTATSTNTATLTPTSSKTSTATRTRTKTPVPSDTPIPSNTVPPTATLTEAPTAYP